MADSEKLQGVWKIVAAERGGKPLPADVLHDAQIEFAGDSMTTTVKGRANSYKFSLDPSQSPTAIDLDMGTAVGKGVYRLDGDCLSIAHGEAGDGRPAGFVPEPGSRTIVMTLRRAEA